MTRQLSRISFALLALMLLAGTCLACSSDADCGSADAPGSCVGGVCQCGVGFAGNIPIDPIACNLVCAPPAVPDSVAFLNEPSATLSASAGNLQLSVVQDSYLKQNPSSVAFLNPSNGSRCSLLGQMLGQGVWTQGVDAGSCDQTYQFSAAFGSQVSQACWEELPASTETGAQFAIDFRNFKTQLEVVQTGLAPFGQSATRAGGETTITREFRRNYTMSVATAFRPNSAPFLVEATGLVQYRLVLIDNDLLAKKIVARIETRVADTAKLTTASINAGSSGLSGLFSPVSVTPNCDAASPAGQCTQFVEVEFLDDPCQVTAGDLKLDVVFACANGSDPSTCGYTGMPAGNVFELPNNLITYDVCPVTVEYGLDVTNSWLRLHEDSARAVVLSTPPLLESTVYGRVQLQGAGDAVFSSATVSELHIWQVASPANVDLGDQKTSSFLTVALDTSTAANPTIDFELTLDPAFFDIANSYYVEAYVDLVFANTGPLTRKMRVALSLPRIAPASSKRSIKAQWQATKRSADMRNQVVFLSTDRDADIKEESSNKGVFSATFKLAKREQDSGEEAGSSDNLGLIIGAAVGGACVVAAAIIIVVVIVKKRRRRNEEEISEVSTEDISI